MWDSPGSPSETCPNSSLSSARGARTSVSPLRGINHGHSRGIPTSQSHACPPPNPPVSSGARGPSLRRSALPTRRPSPASGQAAASSGWGHCLPPATKAPQRPWGVAAGVGPSLRPPRPRGHGTPAHVQPQPCTALRNPFRPPRVPPQTPALCPSPNSPLAPSGSEDCARPPGSKPAPALGETFQLAIVPTTSESGAPAGARGAGGPREDTYRLPGRVRARAPGCLLPSPALAQVGSCSSLFLPLGSYNHQGSHMTQQAGLQPLATPSAAAP